MRIRYKAQSVILLSACLIFLSGIAFSQNIDTLKSDIYPRLKCCDCQVSFDKCTCTEAKEMKTYIDALLDSGLGKEEVFYKVAKKFSLNTILDAQTRAEVEKRLIKEAGEKRPQIILNPVSFDLGRMSKKKGRVGVAFRVSNKGNAPLLIKQIKTSCPCATASLKVDKKKSPHFGIEGSPEDWQAGIKPGQAGGLEVTIDFSSQDVKSGKLIRDATITSNDPLYPEVSVRVEAEVTE